MRQQAAAVEPSIETEEESEAGVMGTRKGTTIISLAPSKSDKVTLRKTRTTGNLRQHYKTDDPRFQHSGSYTNGYGSREGSISERNALSHEPSLALRQESTDDHAFRNASLSTAFAGLSLTPQHQCNASDLPSRPSFERNKEQVSPSKIPRYAHTPSLRHARSAQELRTPSPLKDKSSRDGLRTPFASVKRKPVPLPVYLTKEKLTTVPAWDTKGRLEDMVSLFEAPSGGDEAYLEQENLYAMLRTQFASADDSKNALEASLSVYKGRGLLIVDRRAANAC
jgi:kinesin family protein C1